MVLEIERKFEMEVRDFKLLAKSNPVIFIDQGYLILKTDYHLRVRVCNFSDDVLRYESSIASKTGSGMSRYEYEQTVETQHALLLLKQSLKRVRKQRIKIKHKGLVWDVDYFLGHNLAVAEVEIPCEDFPIARPPWVGDEVTGVKKYSNIRLAK